MKKIVLITSILINITACKADNASQQPSHEPIHQPNTTIPHEKTNQSSLHTENKIPEEHTESKTPEEAPVSETTQSAQAKDDGFHEKFEKELILYAANSKSYERYPTVHFDLYSKGSVSQNNVKPLLSIITKEPVKTEYILTKEHDTGERTGEYVFRNDMDLVFYGNNGKSKALRMNISDSNYIVVKVPYKDSEFTIAKLEIAGQGLSPEDYSWVSCLVVYNKNINRIIDLNPFGCSIDNAYRNSLQNMSRKVERYDITFNSFTKNDGLYTLKLTNTPKLEVGEFDKNNAKQLTYQFRINPNASIDEQLETVKTTMTYIKSGKFIEGFEDYGFAFEVDD